MISEKSGNKNNVIYGALAGIVSLAIVFVILYFFVFSGSNTQNAGLENGEEMGIIEKIQIKNLDMGIFQDQRFLNLKDSKTSLPDISELNPGKDNPFKAD
ncbi:hypothetical protein DRH27_02720 [Candidatus Falkowbacteria bacterium]|nr:MAG: hypothetical protein DRH27_02720 [Candidatus Falkowbacteria bacterium]